MPLTAPKREEEFQVHVSGRDVPQARTDFLRRHGRRLTLIFAILSFVTFAFLDFSCCTGSIVAETRLSTPVFQEKGHAFFAYMPELRTMLLFNADSNVLKGTKLIASPGHTPLRPAALETVRESGNGTCFQAGDFIWFSMPGSGDANAPDTSISVVTPLRLKPLLKYTTYGALALLSLICLFYPVIQRFLENVHGKHPKIALVFTMPVSKLSQFLQRERWVVFPLAVILSIRTIAFPPLFNFLDTFTMLRAPLSIVGAMPPLYMFLIAGLKHRLGLGHSFLNVLLAAQYSLFAVALLYLCSVFKTSQQKLLALSAFALNFYIPLIVGGIMTESLAVSEQIILFTAGIRILAQKRAAVRDCIVLAVACALCVLTRHTFVLFATAIPLYCLLKVLFQLKSPLKSVKRLLLVSAICAVGALSGMLISAQAYKFSSQGGSVPVGLWGVQLMARGWQHIKDSDRQPTYELLSSRTNDPLIRATFRTLLLLPNSDQTMYDFTTLYKLIQETTRKEYGSKEYTRACDSKELSKATTAATFIFLKTGDRYYWHQVLMVFLEYTQLQQLLFASNPQYQFDVIKSNDSVDALGNGWNFPNVAWGHLNRCLLEHSAISDMWSPLCEDTRRITDRTFSAENKNALRDAINGRVFWALDFFNPATNLSLLLLGIIIGSCFRRISTSAGLLGLAVIGSVLIYDLFHALTTQITLSRYLAPASMQLMLGILVVYCELLFGCRLLDHGDTEPTK